MRSAPTPSATRNRSPDCALRSDRVLVQVAAGRILKTAGHSVKCDRKGVAACGARALAHLCVMVEGLTPCPAPVSLKRREAGRVAVKTTRVLVGLVVVGIVGIVASGASARAAT